MKRPKKLKFPKMPKSSSSPEVWERYYKRCQEITKRNDERLKPFNTRSKKIQSIKDQVKRLRGK